MYLRESTKRPQTLISASWELSHFCTFSFIAVDVCEPSLMMSRNCFWTASLALCKNGGTKWCFSDDITYILDAALFMKIPAMLSFGPWCPWWWASLRALAIIKKRKKSIMTGEWYSDIKFKQQPTNDWKWVFMHFWRSSLYAPPSVHALLISMGDDDARSRVGKICKNSKKTSPQITIRFRSNQLFAEQIIAFRFADHFISTASLHRSVSYSDCKYLQGKIITSQNSLVRFLEMAFCRIWGFSTKCKLEHFWILGKNHWQTRRC